MRLERQAASQMDGATTFAPEPLPRGQPWALLGTGLLEGSCRMHSHRPGLASQMLGQGSCRLLAGPASRLLQEPPPPQPELGLCPHIAGQGAHSRQLMPMRRQDAPP